MNELLEEWLAIAQRQWVRSQGECPHQYQDIARQKSASTADAILIASHTQEGENDECCNESVGHLRPLR